MCHTTRAASRSVTLSVTPQEQLAHVSHQVSHHLTPFNSSQCSIACCQILFNRIRLLYNCCFFSWNWQASVFFPTHVEFPSCRGKVTPWFNKMACCWKTDNTWLRSMSVSNPFSTMIDRKVSSTCTSQDSRQISIRASKFGESTK